jgi:tetratricopeptide (TPR) repeat protein
MSPKRLKILLATLVALAAILVYANSLGNDFAYDDDGVIYNRESVHGLSNLPELLVEPYWPEPMFDEELYRPLILLTYAVDWKIWNGKPFGFHLVNVLLHAAVSVLLALLLLRFFSWRGALAGGLIFAVHSVHTEAVANIVGRAELMVAFFALIAALIYTRAVRDVRISARWVALIVLCYVLASFSKELGVVIPGLLLATDLPLIGRRQAGTLKQFVRVRLPLFVVLTATLAGYLVIRWAVLGASVESVPDRIFAIDNSFATRFFTMSRVWVRYVNLLLFPLDLSADYSPAVILPAEHLTGLGVVGIAVVLGSAVVSVASLRKFPEIGMAALWIAIALLPVSNLVITANIVLAERTLYLASAAVSFLAALLLERAAPAYRRFVAIGMALWIVGFSIVTVRRNPVWENTDTVFEDLRRNHPESSRLLYGIGLTYDMRGEWDEAVKWYRKSLAIWPYAKTHLRQFTRNLYERGQYEEAAYWTRIALQIQPEKLRHHYVLSLCLVRGGDPTGGLEAIERAFAIVGPNAALYTLQAEAYAQLGDLERAVLAQEAAVRGRRPEPDWESWHRLASLRAQAGDTVAALIYLEQARRSEGADPLVADSLEAEWRGLIR